MAEEAWWDSLGPDFDAAIRSAEPRGRMSYPELNAVLPNTDVTTRQIESVLEYLRQKGIELYEADGS